ncbi:SAV_6107 family HEPN domain-containing protein [Corynebacterium callunae]|uniref:SAV_6107 family HEPN domain-containing protein n=1 Tax=Corynebacterium callunae TaxID=1721 RepID=UPI003982BC0C
MGEIISATTRFMRVQGKEAEFLSKATVLLRQAKQHRREGDLLLALELGYQSALRTAGAVIAGSPVAKRKRKPRGAWDQLRLVDAQAATWADELSQFSQLRSRAASGLAVSLSQEKLDRFLLQVAHFLEEAEQSLGWSTEAA